MIIFFQSGILFKIEVTLKIDKTITKPFINYFYDIVNCPSLNDLQIHCWVVVWSHKRILCPIVYVIKHFFKFFWHIRVAPDGYILVMTWAAIFLRQNQAIITNRFFFILIKNHTFASFVFTEWRLFHLYKWCGRKWVIHTVLNKLANHHIFLIMRITSMLMNDIRIKINWYFGF